MKRIMELLTTGAELAGFGIAAWGLVLWTGEPGAGLLFGGVSIVLLAALAGSGGEE